MGTTKEHFKTGSEEGEGSNVYIMQTFLYTIKTNKKRKRENENERKQETSKYELYVLYCTVFMFSVSKKFK